MMALVLLFLVQTVRTQDGTPARISYSEFLQHLETGLVHKVVFRDRAIEGEFSAPVNIDSAEYVEFEARTPGDVTDGLLEQLRSEGVVIYAEAPEAGWETFLLTALPWLLFIAFWGVVGGTVHVLYCRKHGIHPVHATPRRKYYELRNWAWQE